MVVSNPGTRALARPADLEIGDTAGLETCATRRRCLATKSAQAAKASGHRSTDGRRSKTVASLVSVMIGEPISIALACHHPRFTDSVQALSPNACFAIELPDARHFILELQYADRAYHFGDGDPG